jgi:Uncharacterized conserved protein (COG2071)
VRLRQPIHDLLLALWRVEAGDVGSRLPNGFEPTLVDGRALVAVACFRNRLARLGALPVPPYAEVDLRTFVRDREGAPAVFVLEFFVPPVGLAAGPFGVPVQVARIRVSRGRVSAPGLGVSAEYAVGEPAGLGDLGPALASPASAYWLKNGRLRRMAGGYEGASWRRAELRPGARFGPAERVGLDAGRPDLALYAERAQLRATLPARPV